MAYIDKNGNRVPGVRNTFSAILRGHHGTFDPPKRQNYPPGFTGPRYTQTKITKGRIIVEEGDDGNKTKTRERSHVTTTTHIASAGSRMVNHDTGEEIFHTSTGWAVFGENGRRMTERGYDTPDEAFNATASVRRESRIVREERPPRRDTRQRR